MRKTSSKKLKLNRETLAQLDLSQVAKAAGGMTLPHSDAPTYECTLASNCCTNFNC